MTITLVTSAGSLPLNPFANAELGHLDCLHDLDERFRRWIGGHKESLEEVLGELLLSAILYGGLAGPCSWQPWLDAILCDLTYDAPTAVFIDFVVISDETVQSKLHRRWFADPVTAVLIRRWRRAQSSRNLSTVHPALNVLLAMHGPLGLPSEAAGQFLEWFAPGVALRLRLSIPPVLADHALGNGESQTVRSWEWAQLNRTPNPLAFAMQSKDEFVSLLPPESRRQPAQKDYLFFPNNEDLNIRMLRTVINKHIVEGRKNNGASGNRHRNARAVRAAMIELLEEKSPDKPDTVREVLFGLFHRFASSRPAEPQPRIGTRTIGTMVSYLDILGRVDWRRFWSINIHLSTAGVLDQLYSNIIAKANEQEQGLATGFILAFNKYVRASSTHLSLWVPADKTDAGKISVKLISSAQFRCALALLTFHPAGMRDSIMCRIAATLMFRAGLRAQEVRFLRIDDIDGADEFAELTIRTNTDAAAKNRGSYRRLPIGVLLMSTELNELMQWRARRIVELRGGRSGRLFDDEVAQSAGLSQARLLTSIEQALIMASGKPSGTKPSHKWALGGALRHSFASYLLATLLLPDDAGTLSLPAGIDADCVSAARRERVAPRLLYSGRLGQAAVHAVSLLMGHAHISRLLAVYAHLLDWSLGAQLWRWSLQPGFDPLIVRRLVCDCVGKCRLPGASSKNSAVLCSTAAQCSNLTHLIRKTSQRRGAHEQAFLTQMSIEHGVRRVPPIRATRPRGRQAAASRLLGSAFIDQCYEKADFKNDNKPKPRAVAYPTPPPPQLKPLTTGQLVDAVLSLWRRNMPEAEIAQILCLDIGLCRRWIGRAKQIMAIMHGKKSRHPSFERRIAPLASRSNGTPARSSARLIGQGRLALEAAVIAKMGNAFERIDRDAAIRAFVKIFLERARSGQVSFRLVHRADQFLHGLHKIGISAEQISQRGEPMRVSVGPHGPERSLGYIRHSASYGLLLLAVVSDRLRLPGVDPGQLETVYIHA